MAQGAAPKTLAELAELASIDVTDLHDYTDDDFEQLAQEHSIPVTPKVRLRKAFRKLKQEGGASPSSALDHSGGDALHGLDGQCSRIAGCLAERITPMDSVAARFQPLLARGLVDFLDTMKPIEEAGIIPQVMRWAEATLAKARDEKEFGNLKDDPLDIQGVAFVMKYTAEDSHPLFYGDMNSRCYMKDRTNIDPYGMYMVCFVQHLQKIEPYPNGAVFRGVKADLRENYPKGREFTWHGFCSTTKSMEVLSNPQFCGTTGKRTIFNITLTQGQARDITRYSLVGTEDEVLLPPGCRFIVESILPQGDLTIIQLTELASNEWILDLRSEACVPHESESAAEGVPPEPELSAHQTAPVPPGSGDGSQLGMQPLKEQGVVAVAAFLEQAELDASLAPHLCTELEDRGSQPGDWVAALTAMSAETFDELIQAAQESRGSEPEPAGEGVPPELETKQIAPRAPVMDMQHDASRGGAHLRWRIKPSDQIARWEAQWGYPLVGSWEDLPTTTDEVDDNVEDDLLFMQILRMVPTSEKIDSMNVEELRSCISAAEMSFADCTEKSELHARALEAAAKGMSGGATCFSGTVNGWEVGSCLVFRVRGVNAAGPGEWSDPSPKLTLQADKTIRMEGALPGSSVFSRATQLLRRNE